MTEEPLSTSTLVGRRTATLDWARSLQETVQPGEDLSSAVARLEAATARLEAQEAHHRSSALAWGFAGGFLGALCGAGLLGMLLT
ncbi:MAG: hypothetical protein H6742_07525 [Alphaproteobacteria bacterium]|nr:hypothetical protein [Alphaproteobacteria bacterium]